MMAGSGVVAAQTVAAADMGIGSSGEYRLSPASPGETSGPTVMKNSAPDPVLVYAEAAALGIPVKQLPQAPVLAMTPAVAPPERMEMAQPTLKVLREQMRHGKYDVSKIGDRNVGSGLDFYSVEKERALGRELAMEVEQESKLINDPVITEYVNRVGQNLVRNSDAKVPFTIKVIDNEEINAFALPGGFFYVNSGLILAAENEAELAGVMAHEIAHVAARHATKNETKSEILNLASMPLIFMGGPAGFAVRQLVGLALPMTYLKFSRNAEREADLLGMEYQYATGYDPEEFVHFFERMKATEKQKQSLLVKAFSTHPMTSDRVKRAQETIARYLPPRDEYVIDTSEFDAVKARLAGLMHRKIGAGGQMLPTLHKRDAQDGPPKLERK